MRIEEADPLEARVTLNGFSDSEGPVGDEDAARLIVPAKPLWLAKLIVEVPVVPD